MPRPLGKNTIGWSISWGKSGTNSRGVRGVEPRFLVYPFNRRMGIKVPSGGLRKSLDGRAVVAKIVITAAGQVP